MLAWSKIIALMGLSAALAALITWGIHALNLF
jgi:hypothetical protein